MNRLGVLVYAIATLIAIGSCGGGKGSSSTPTNPTPTPTVSGVTVTGPTSSAKPGDSAQFTATAVMSNSTTQTVTNQASWQSSNGSLATVSTSGMVTAIAAGEVDLRATYQSVTGSAHITITAPTLIGFSICGTVKEEGTNTGLSGATVVVKDTSFSATSDALGTYCITGLGGGRVVLRATRSGYNLTEVEITVSGNVTRDIAMAKTSSPAPNPTPNPSPSPAPTCCRVCTTGKPCGDTCISKDDTCHVGPGCACQGIGVSDSLNRAMPPLEYTPVPLPVRKGVQ